MNARQRLVVRGFDSSAVEWDTELILKSGMILGQVSVIFFPPYFEAYRTTYFFRAGRVVGWFVGTLLFNF